MELLNDHPNNDPRGEQGACDADTPTETVMTLDKNEEESLWFDTGLTIGEIKTIAKDCICYSQLHDKCFEIAKERGIRE